MQSLAKSSGDRKRRNRSQLAAACLTVWVGSTSSTAAIAEDCHCHAGHGPIYRTLDAFAGGIEKLLRLDQPARGACDEFACDGGCDALSMQDVMQMPMEHQPFTHGDAGPMYMEDPGLPAVPQPMMEPQPMMQRSAPPASMQMSPHRMTPMSESSQPNQMPMQIREQQGGPTGSGVMPSDQEQRDSIFDSLQDPFRDDSARIHRSQPVPSRPASYRTSLRRTHNSR